MDNLSAFYRSFLHNEIRLKCLVFLLLGFLISCAKADQLVEYSKYDCLSESNFFEWSKFSWWSGFRISGENIDVSSKSTECKFLLGAHINVDNKKIQIKNSNLLYFNEKNPFSLVRVYQDKYGVSIEVCFYRSTVSEDGATLRRSPGGCVHMALQPNEVEKNNINLYGDIERIFKVAPNESDCKSIFYKNNWCVTGE